MIVALLVLHGLLAVALLGAITHQALSVLALAPSANGRWTFVARFRGVDATAYATPIVVLFAVTAVPAGGRGRIRGLPSTTRAKTPLIVLIVHGFAHGPQC